MSRPWLLLTLGLLAVAIGGCSGSSDVVTIGTKGFAEQSIIAEATRQLLMARADARAEIVECGDTYECQQALRGGSVDLMIEYTGTAALFLGIDPSGPQASSKLTRACEHLGLSWRPALGFDNSYRLVVASPRAAEHGLRRIADLASLEGGIRVACPRSYLRRPRDGLASLLERHGLHLRGEALLLGEPTERIDAVLAGRADVAVVYGTDGALRDGGVTLLEDSLRFFPKYEAALLVRQDTLARRPELATAFEALEGQLSTETMRRLNYSVQIEGWSPDDAAHRFLVSQGLLERGEEGRSRLKLVLAVAEADDLEGIQPRAIRALRQVFSDRPVELRVDAHPARLVAKGTAKLALLGAERFFDSKDGVLRRSGALEAVAVVGSRMVHVVRSGSVDAPVPEDPLSGRMGVQPEDSGAGRIGRDVLAAAGRQPAADAPATTLLSQIEEGQLDGALIVVEVGAPLISKALAEGRARLFPLQALSREQMPYLRPSRLPANTYEGQVEPLETLAAQIVLAGPRRRPLRNALRPGPGSALLVEATPLPIEEVHLLAEATGVAEWPDPVLPVAWTRAGEGEESVSTNAVLNTVLNVLVLAFLGWLIALVLPSRGRSPKKSGAESKR